MPIYSFQCQRCGDEFEVMMPWETLHELRGAPCDCGGWGEHLFKVPAVHGDELRGMGTLLDQFEGDEVSLNKRIEAAKAQGFTPGINSVYEPTLAQYPGDPRAFVDASAGKSGRRKIADAILKAPPRKKTALAPDIVKRLEQKYLKKDPSLKNKPGELRERVLANHTYKGS